MKKPTLGVIASIIAISLVSLLACWHSVVKCRGWWTEGEPEPVEGFIKRFPEIPRVANRSELIDDPAIDLILIADVPVKRAERAIEAMVAGKDV